MKRKIIAVDDDIAMIRLYQMHFRMAGYEAHFFQSGKLALEQVESICPDVAVFDYDLPDMKGIELVRSMKQNEVLAKVPILMVTGKGRDSVSDELRAEGAHRVFGKPFSPSLLMREMKGVLGE